MRRGPDQIRERGFSFGGAFLKGMRNKMFVSLRPRTEYCYNSAEMDFSCHGRSRRVV